MAVHLMFSVWIWYEVRYKLNQRNNQQDLYITYSETALLVYEKKLFIRLII